MIAKLIEFFEKQYKLAEALEVSEAAVSQWVKKGYLPAARAIQIEEITGGIFNAKDLIKSEDTN